MSKKILLITGGTGGHVIPAVNFFNYLSNKDQDCKIMIDKRGNRYLFLSKKNVFVIRSSSLSGNVFVKIKGVIDLLFGFIKSTYIIFKYKPDIVISFGSYASLTPMLVCVIFKNFYSIKLYIHEQNTVIGRTNKLFLNSVDKFFLNFDIKQKLNKNLLYKSYVVGSPGNVLYLNNNNDNNNINIDIFTIFVYGGSQGSEYLINFIINLIKTFNLNEITNFKFIIQCPSNLVSTTSNILKKYHCNFVIQEFYKEIEYILENTSLVISRAGAGTINDLINYKKPSILIPLPKSKDNHQNENAKILSCQNLALCLNQSNNDFRKAKKYINELLNDKKKIMDIKKKFEKIKIKNTNELIYNLVLNEKN